MEMQKPRKMARPPILGVGWVWRCRSLSVPALPGMSIAPSRMARRRTRGMTTMVTTRATTRAATTIAREW